jgi:hypothetical protein
MTRVRAVAVALNLAALALAAAAAPPAAADSFTPVKLTISVAPVARARAPLHITVRVTADPGALDTRSAPLRIRVKLASECGGTYRYTNGSVLLDQRLNPQPTTNRAYDATARGAGRPTTYGSLTVCTWLQEEGDDRIFASDQSIQVNVSRACTVAAARYDAARRRHRGRGTLGRARRRARRACGRGVPL